MRVRVQSVGDGLLNGPVWMVSELYRVEGAKDEGPRRDEVLHRPLKALHYSGC